MIRHHRAQRSVFRASHLIAELQKLTGYLQFITRITLQGQLHLRYLYAAEAWFPGPSSTVLRRRITQNMRNELFWWHDILHDPNWNGMSMISPESTPSQEMHIWTDAATSKGIGGYFVSGPFNADNCPTNADLENEIPRSSILMAPNPLSITPDHAFYAKPPLKLRKKARIMSDNRASIHILELYAIYYAIDRWGPQHFAEKTFTFTVTTLLLLTRFCGNQLGPSSLLWSSSLDAF